MTNTPIDRKSVERLADFLQDEDLHEEAQRHVADTLLALRAALDEAEAERHRWRQAASIGSIHTQADLDRAVAEARAVALESVIANIRLDVENDDISTGAGQWIIDTILALLDTPAAEALERVRQEARAAALQEAADTYAENDGMPWDYFGAAYDAILALINTPAAEALAERDAQIMQIILDDVGYTYEQLGEEAREKLPTPAEALERVRAEAYLSGWVNGSNGIEPPDFGNPVFEKAPGAEALAARDERVRAEEREACFSAAEYVSDGRIAALQADSAEADDPYGDGLLDEAVSLSAEMLAAIRARGETKKAPGD